MKNKIFVACDTSNINIVKKIIKNTKTEKLNIIPKFGMEFFYSQNSREFLKNYKKQFWLDLKINDIPQTSLGAFKSLNDLKNLKYMTVHASCGFKTLKAIKKKVRKDIKILGVTILTSLKNEDLKTLGYSKPLNYIVNKQAKLIQKAGIDGLVCSGYEGGMLKKKFKRLFIVCPGIRMPGDKNNDQVRIVTPHQALIKNKVDAIVMGRSITKGNIKKNINKLISHLEKNVR